MPLYSLIIIIIIIIIIVIIIIIIIWKTIEVKWVIGYVNKEASHQIKLFGGKKIWTLFSDFLRKLHFETQISAGTAEVIIIIIIIIIMWKNIEVKWVISE
jgi:hypothetical protein